MTELTVYNMKNEEVGKHQLPDTVYSCDKYEHLFHESVRLHLASKRAGTASTKRQHEVRGVEIDSTLLAEDREMLEDILVAAFNDAIRKVQNTVQERFAGMTAGLGLPGGFKLPF